MTSLTRQQARKAMYDLVAANWGSLTDEFFFPDDEIEIPVIQEDVSRANLTVRHFGRVQDTMGDHPHYESTGSLFFDVYTPKGSTKPGDSLVGSFRAIVEGKNIGGVCYEGVVDRELTDPDSKHNWLQLETTFTYREKKE